jgi:hypothetical protein
MVWSGVLAEVLPVATEQPQLAEPVASTYLLSDGSEARTLPS